PRMRVPCPVHGFRPRMCVTPPRPGFRPHGAGTLKCPAGLHPGLYWRHPQGVEEPRVWNPSGGAAIKPQGEPCNSRTPRRNAMGEPRGAGRRTPYRACPTRQPVDRSDEPPYTETRSDGRRRRTKRMLAKRIIPCLDVDRGRVVKGVNFLNLRDAGDPVEVA